MMVQSRGHGLELLDRAGMEIQMTLQKTNVMTKEELAEWKGIMDTNVKVLSQGFTEVIKELNEMKKLVGELKVKILIFTTLGTMFVNAVVGVIVISIAKGIIK